MKVNVSGIVRGHFETLRDANTSRVSVVDIVTFFVVPLSGGIAAYYVGLWLDKEVYSVSITFFGIFIALLLNIQVAMFSILQRKWEIPRDKNVAATQAEKREQRRRLLYELNSNISYLVLFSCLSLSWFVVLFARLWTTGVSVAVSVSIYLHFLLTLVMVVKRAHALFQREYLEGAK